VDFILGSNIFLSFCYLATLLTLLTPLKKRFSNVKHYATKGDIVMMRGEKVCAFIEAYCKIPEGAHVAQPIKLMKFQKQFIRSAHDQ